MYNDNKYSQLSRNALIRGIQTLAMTLEEQKRKKNNGSASYVRSMRELNSARGALIPLLHAGDRNTTEFFPVGSHVQYQKPHPLDDMLDFNSPVVHHAPKNGVVTGYDGQHLIIQLEGEQYGIFAWPAHTKLRFISSSH